MATKDVLSSDLDLAARQGLEKLGYTQEMTRVRIVERPCARLGLTMFQT